MSHRLELQLITLSILLATPIFAANPFLEAKDDKPVSASFRGTEWNDEYIKGDIALTARALTTRIAQMPWGAIFRIEFVDLKSRAKQKREIRPQYFIATDDRIYLLNEEDNEAAAKKLAATDKAPNFEQGDIRSIARQNGIRGGPLHHNDRSQRRPVLVHYESQFWPLRKVCLEEGHRLGRARS